MMVSLAAWLETVSSKPKKSMPSAPICGGQSGRDANAPVIERIDPGSIGPMGGDEVALDGRNLVGPDGSLPSLTLGGQVVTFDPTGVENPSTVYGPSHESATDLSLGRFYGNVLERIDLLRPDGAMDSTMIFYHEVRYNWGKLHRAPAARGFACLLDTCRVTTNNSGIREDRPAATSGVMATTWAVRPATLWTMAFPGAPSRLQCLWRL